ncbi:MAG: hypothetical protein Q7O66_10975 [Dehalococcoidia bacterium]|nr:hypothetical protein [Dehalococcoidia bacterium]
MAGANTVGAAHLAESIDFSPDIPTLSYYWPHRHGRFLIWLARSRASPAIETDRSPSGQSCRPRHSCSNGSDGKSSKARPPVRSCSRLHRE